MRSHLEYAPSVWAPHTVKDIQALEGVQKFACRMATNLWFAGYDELLSLLGFERRRLKQKLCYLFKFVHNLCFFPPGLVTLRDVISRYTQNQCVTHVYCMNIHNN